MVKQSNNYREILAELTCKDVSGVIMDYVINPNDVDKDQKLRKKVINATIETTNIRFKNDDGGDDKEFIRTILLKKCVKKDEKLVRNRIIRTSFGDYCSFINGELSYFDFVGINWNDKCYCQGCQAYWDYIDDYALFELDNNDYLEDENIIQDYIIYCCGIKAINDKDEEIPSLLHSNKNNKTYSYTTKINGTRYRWDYNKVKISSILH